MIKFKCPRCKSTIRVASSLAGGSEPCSVCQHVCNVPAATRRHITTGILIGVGFVAGCVCTLTVALVLWPEDKAPASPPTRIVVTKPAPPPAPIAVTKPATPPARIAITKPAARSPRLPRSAAKPRPVAKTQSTVRRERPTPKPAPPPRMVARHGDIKVRILSAKVAEEPFKDQFGSIPSKMNLLSIRIELTNLSNTRKLNYKPFTIRRGYKVYGRDYGAYMRADKLLTDYATLKDNYGNSYRRFIYFVDGRPRTAAMAKPGPVYPGKSIADTIVFEVPVENVKHLDLKIPAAGFGGVEPIYVRIPARKIKRAGRGPRKGRVK